LEPPRSWHKTVASAIAALTFLSALTGNDALADGIVKIRLLDTDTSTEITGTATLTGTDLKGHLTGSSSDIVVTGFVSDHSVRVNLAGRIVLSCSPVQQFMSGNDSRYAEVVSIGMTLNCLNHPSINFIIELALPAHPLIPPAASGQGQSASTR
jgi:hypothetical protein